MHPILCYRSWFVLTISVLLLSACSETSIDPFENDGNYFTVYGFLNDAESSHVLRVIPVTRNVERINSPSDDQATIDAVVYTTDLNTGVRTTWTHNLEKFSDGSYGHIFRANFRVAAQKTYKLEIIRSDGKMTTATTQIPYISQPDLFELGPEIFSEDSTEVYMDIKIPNIPSPWEIHSKYFWIPAEGNDLWVFVPYGRSGFRTDDDGWQIRINISGDQDFVRKRIQQAIEDDELNATTGIAGVSSMGLRIRILDEGWDPPDGIFDPEILSQPGRLSNVENGYGYFGSVGLYAQEWNFDHLSVLLGYDF